MSVLGWIYMGLAIIGGIIVIAETDDPSGVVIIILGVIAGIIVVAMGQALTCFVSMERGIQDIKRELQSLNKG